MRSIFYVITQNKHTNEANYKHPIWFALIQDLTFSLLILNFPVPERGGGGEYFSNS